MLRAKQDFDSSHQRVQNIHALYKHLKNDLHFQSSFLDDLLRSEIVYMVSALDKFIHDIVKIGILESYNGIRPKTAALNNFSINLAQMDLITNPGPTSSTNQILESIIVENHKHLSFQDPDKITGALSLIWLEQHKWQKIASLLAKNESDVKIELKNIVIRRNQIVHEADINLFTNSTQNISESDIEHQTDFITNIVHAIYNLVKV